MHACPPPCMVPSCDRRTSPSMSNSALSLYVLVKGMARGGHSTWRVDQPSVQTVGCFGYITSRTATVSSYSKILCMACMAASLAASRNWEVHATSWMSIPMMQKMALPIMQQTVFPTPIGRTAGF